MNRRRAAVPLLIATLVATLGGTSYAVVGGHHDARTASPHAAAPAHHATATRSGTTAKAPAARQSGRSGTSDRVHRGPSVTSLLRGSYTAGSARLSGTTKPVVKNKQLPTITGRPVVGGSLVATPGKWSPMPVQLSYQWFSGDKLLRGATKATYLPTVKSLGARLTVAVTAKKKDYKPATAVSASSGKVKAGKIVNVKAPVLSGKPKVGQKLSVSAGKWSVGDLALSYQWFRGGKAVTGATKSSLKLKSTDIGKKFYVVVTALRDGYKPASVTSASTKPVTK